MRPLQSHPLPETVRNSTFECESLWLQVEVEVDNPSHPRVGFEETGDEFCLSWRLVGRFAESWELQNFPFDCQDFTVSMMIRYPAKRGDLRMMPVDSQQSQIRQKAFPVLQNTWYHPKQSRLHVWEEKVPRVEPKPNAERVIMRPTVNVTVSMRRIPNYYLMNVVMPMFFIVCMGFGSLLVPHDQVWDRFSASFTVVLTAVAYKFVVAQMVPPIGYSTWLDEYMTLCFLILMAVVLENCLAVRVRSIHENELVAGCIIFVLFVLLNLRFAQKACSARRRHSRITEQLRRCDPEQIRIGAESFQKLPCMEDDPLPSAVDVTHHFVSQTDSSEGSASS